MAKSFFVGMGLSLIGQKLIGGLDWHWLWVSAPIWGGVGVLFLYNALVDLVLKSREDSTLTSILDTLSVMDELQKHTLFALPVTIFTKVGNNPGVDQAQLSIETGVDPGTIEPCLQFLREGAVIKERVSGNVHQDNEV